MAPLQARARERYEAIVAATRAEIGEKGFDALTIFGIARRARITPTSVYRYFESVEQILTTMTSRAIADLEAEIGRLMESAESIDELIAAFGAAIRASWRAFSKNPEARGIWSASKYLPQLRALDEALNERVVDRVCRRFEDLAPTAHAAGVRRVVTLWVGLTTPAFDLALQKPRKLQSALIDEFVETAILRLNGIRAGGL